ncbi:hypothetical protein ABT294_30865 [Nonomuraea sp. NPDC000554]|uniref:hypothetical protein n=1 Tax=Nonomuraea sp. NPDC000554 TaxID=3154259 RepID=UPI00331CBB60
MKTDIDDIVAQFAAEPVTEVSDGARELMHEITACEPAPVPLPARRRLTWRLAVPATALVAAAVVGLTWALPLETGFGPTAAQALDIDQEDGYYVIKINDLYANPKLYQDQLRAAGLDISLEVRPVGPAFEGQVFPTTPDHQYIEEIKGIYPPGECDKLDGCAIGVKIPTTFKGTAEISIGRKAEPGEQYEGTTSFDAKGEPMHCVPYLNKTVAELRPILEERGVSITAFNVEGPEGTETKDSVPDSYHVTGGVLDEPGKATITVTELPLDAEALRDPDADCATQ